MVNKLTNAVWLGLGAIGAIWLLTSLAGVVQGGDLDPPAIPGSTMQELDDLPPAWHKEISGAARFEDFGQAQGYVLDHETGLVWEKAPDAASRTWEGAIRHCYLRIVAGEVGQSLGFRLPTIAELLTLAEPMTAGTPKLPDGHPFTGIQGGYWSATTEESVLLDAYFWNTLLTNAQETNKTITKRVWCVRAPTGMDYAGG